MSFLFDFAFLVLLSLIFKELRTIESILKTAVRAFLPTRIIFLNPEGQEIEKMQIQDNQTLSVSIAAQDAKRNPAPLDPTAVPSWSVDQPSLASVAPSADGLSCVVTPSGALGSFNVQCSIPAVNSESALQGSLPVQVIASAASQIVLNGVASS